jgi:nodulation protein A
VLDGTGPPTGYVHAMDDLTWSVSWETDLDDADHPALAGLLACAYPGEAHRFGAGHSWTGARPELRVVARRADAPVAHAGLIRRFLRAVPEDGPVHEVLVGDVGLVAVDPDQHGRGLGRALLTRVVEVLVGLDTPFGFLTCGPDVEGFYRAAGWTRLDDVAVRTITLDHRTVTDHDPAMVHPAGRPLADWPPGGTVARDGQMP